MTDTPKRAAIFSSPLFVPECREYADEHGFNVVLEVIAITGASAQAESIQTLLKKAQAGNFEIVILPLFQQLGNTDEDIATMLLTLEALGVQIVTSTQHHLGELGTTTFTTLIETIRSKAADLEKERLKARRRAG